MRNHTATHLLHRALQEVLGEHAQQRGSLVAPDRLRFDFAHLKAMSPDELTAIEARVNEWVRDDATGGLGAHAAGTARQAGAMMLFGEKYGDTVRVVTVAGVSKELCGGTHLERTGQIGGLMVTAETSVGAGIRRLEAVTGRGAEQLARQRQEQLERLAALVGSPTVEGLEARVGDALERSRELAREVERLRAELARARADGTAQQVVDVEGVPVAAMRVEAADVDALRGPGGRPAGSPGQRRDRGGGGGRRCAAGGGGGDGRSGSARAPRRPVGEGAGRGPGRRRRWPPQSGRGRWQGRRGPGGVLASVPDLVRAQRATP